MDYSSGPKDPLTASNPSNKGVMGLAAGTLVTTPDGEKKIEDVKAGDLVSSGVGAHESKFYKVGKATAKPYSGSMLRIAVNYSDYLLRLTPNHVCFGFAKNDNFKEDFLLLYAFDADKKGELSHFVCTTGLEDALGEFSDLDYTEEFARQQARNRGGAEIERFANFTFCEPSRFMPATDLKVAMRVPVTKNEVVEAATVTNITEEQYEGLVYTLDIPEARNFAANGVLVYDSISIQL